MTEWFWDLMDYYANQDAWGWFRTVLVFATSVAAYSWWVSERFQAMKLRWKIPIIALSLLLMPIPAILAVFLIKLAVAFPVFIIGFVGGFGSVYFLRSLNDDYDA